MASKRKRCNAEPPLDKLSEGGSHATAPVPAEVQGKKPKAPLLDLQLDLQVRGTREAVCCVSMQHRAHRTPHTAAYHTQGYMGRSSDGGVWNVGVDVWGWHTRRGLLVFGSGCGMCEDSEDGLEVEVPPGLPSSALSSSHTGSFADLFSIRTVPPPAPLSPRSRFAANGRNRCRPLRMNQWNITSRAKVLMPCLRKASTNNSVRRGVAW